MKSKLFLSKAEHDYLLSAGTSLQISDGYSRVIKSRIQKKIERFASEELPILIEKGLILSSMLPANVVTEIRNRSVAKNCNSVEGEGSLDHSNNENTDKNGAGSGIFVPFQDASSHTSRSEAPLGISNPRVLSDMGLAIPRPTRLPPALTTAGLGDPRIFVSVSETIISLLLPFPKGHVGSTLVLVVEISNLLQIRLSLPLYWLRYLGGIVVFGNVVP